MLIILDIINHQKGNVNKIIEKIYLRIGVYYHHDNNWVVEKCYNIVQKKNLTKNTENYGKSL